MTKASKVTETAFLKYERRLADNINAVNGLKNSLRHVGLEAAAEELDDVVKASFSDLNQLRAELGCVEKQ